MMDDQTRGDLASIFGEIKLHFGNAISEAKKQSELLRKMQATADKAQQPINGYRVVQSGIAAGGLVIVRFGGPDQGHVWNVQSITVGGLSPTTVAAGRADVYITAMDLRSQGTLANLGLADWRDQATALPLVAFYGENQMFCRLNEELYVVISNATNGQQYVAVAQVQDIEESAARSVNVQ